MWEKDLFCFGGVVQWVYQDLRRSTLGDYIHDLVNLGSCDMTMHVV